MIEAENEMTSIGTTLRIGVFSVLVLAAPSASAAAPWVDRALTLPRREWAFNFGLGIAHVPGSFGPGFNIEGAASVSHGVEIGLRTGLRFGDPARLGRADVYGRPFDTQTYGTGSQTVANPEFHIRARLVESEVVEVGIEGRTYVPFSDKFGIMPGVPLAFHFGRSARFDTGVFVPIFFSEPTYAEISIPFLLWFQMTNRLWLGPISGVRVVATGGEHTTVPLGFGLGYAVTNSLDFKTQLIFNDVAHSERSNHWGVGAGLEIRVD
jgi:hypothetical protein